MYITNLKNSYDIGWYVWDSKLNDFVKTETTKNFAGIGTRNINKNGIQGLGMYTLQRNVIVK